MGLYLAVFDGDDEIDGVEVGSYADFGRFRGMVIDRLEGGAPGTRFPTLILHSDCAGEWSPAEAPALEQELRAVAEGLKALPPVPCNSEWQQEVAKELAIHPENLYDCLFDVEGEPLVDRLLSLARLSHERGLPILFQ